MRHGGRCADGSERANVLQCHVAGQDAMFLTLAGNAEHWESELSWSISPGALQTSTLTRSVADDLQMLPTLCSVQDVLCPCALQNMLKSLRLQANAPKVRSAGQPSSKRFVQEEIRDVPCN